ncbi:MAG: GTP-binding protein [Candidatus Heimdallarchaeota archaeon]|nr:GTP-binding protein [Candidatus Heimdallarchaeota archaeon]
MTLHKITLLGEPKVGKTTLRRSYMGDSLKTNYIKTIGIDISAKRLERMAFQIWDIAGEATKTSIKSYIKDSSAIILVFDVMTLDTLIQCNKWLNHVNTFLNKPVPVVLVGNKIDLRDGTEIPKDVIKETFNTHMSIYSEFQFKYIETSAINGLRVQEVFEWLQTVLGGK